MIVALKQVFASTKPSPCVTAASQHLVAGSRLTITSQHSEVLPRCRAANKTPAIQISPIDLHKLTFPLDL